MHVLVVMLSIYFILSYDTIYLPALQSVGGGTIVNPMRRRLHSNSGMVAVGGPIVVVGGLYVAVVVALNTI